MLIERTERGLKIRTPAKLNLFLDVLAKRTDGYHQIDTIMCPVSLCDVLEVELTDSSGIEFSMVHLHQASHGAGAVEPCIVDGVDPAWEIPTGDDNLVARALRSVRETLAARGDSSLFGQTGGGCRVRLSKQIPAAAGLGGGSSDAAAAIVAGLFLWAKWDRALATQIAQGLGSDIPLFLGDQQSGIGLARATGRGEYVEILPSRPPLCFVISHPPVGSSTAEVYKLWRSCDENRSCKQMLELLSNWPQCEPATESSSKQDIQLSQLPGDERNGERLRQATEGLLLNALQRPASQLTDWIDRQLQCFAKLGKPAAMMSGSGSACFALVSDLQEGRIIVDKMIELGLPRAYAAQAWYAASIETQLDCITSDPVTIDQRQ